MKWCTFCRIVAREEPAEVLFEDDEVLVFRNRLRWVPVMLLVVPKEHRSQEELWRKLGRGGEGRGGGGGRGLPPLRGGGGPPPQKLNSWGGGGGGGGRHLFRHRAWSW